MTKYLIVKCEPLSDQHECDADREPMFLVDDWEDWLEKNHPTYRFEVYKFVDNEEAELVKDYDEATDEGMALYFWNMDDDHEEVAPTVIAHYKDYNRYSKVPDEVWKVFRQGAYWADDDEYTEKEFKNDLESSGWASWDDKEHEKYWVYGYYEDGRYCLGY